MPYKLKEYVCENCLHAYMGKPTQRWCSKKCAALSPEGKEKRSETMTKTRLFHPTFQKVVKSN
jgi:hypothetical protein